MPNTKLVSSSFSEASCILSCNRSWQMAYLISPNFDLLPCSQKIDIARIPQASSGPDQRRIGSSYRSWDPESRGYIDHYDWILFGFTINYHVNRCPSAFVDGVCRDLNHSFLELIFLPLQWPSPLNRNFRLRGIRKLIPGILGICTCTC